ncbi:MAG: LytR/AlgR family response regulator transcription factor [Lachnospiraceae bacterium]
MLRLAVCDDSVIEQAILKRLLEKLLAERKQECAVRTFSSGEDLMEAFENETFKPDIIFLDIYMGKANGIEVGKKIRKLNTQVEIVYSTTSMDFLMESYEVFALGYLVKPYQPEKIGKLLDYYIEKYFSFDSKVLNISFKGKTDLINYKDIVYIESSNRVVLIHTLSKGDIRIYKKLDEIEEELNSIDFLRCHQSYIVNVHQVDYVDETDFVMKNKSIVPIRKRERKNILGQYMERLDKVSR